MTNQIRLLIIVSILSVCSVLVNAQVVPFSTSRQAVPSKRGGNIFTMEEGKDLSVQVTRDGQITSSTYDPSEMKAIIVEFKEEPFFLQSSPKTKPVDFFQSRFSQFASDLQSLTRRAVSSQQLSFSRPQPGRQFFKTFFGMSMIVPQILINDILALDYVKKVHYDKEMKAFMRETVHIVHADSVWKNFGSQGDSIVVGIIDTGIDYFHPALGGGIGPGYKVIGGYDCYNHDNDPFDDNGHGTHVAGIVAGDGDSLKGIAPKAKLMAFKVLDATGNGSESIVIEGIERAVDPNDDDDPKDKVDIANMSLGSDSGAPDDAVSTAVNNAVKMGMIFCVAAGNTGSYYSIGSPASAALAITVGATDKSDKIASFDSRGPTKRTFALKPDILAPGVNIFSSYPNNKYAVSSGTSMATPVVSGVCALLKSNDKKNTPAMAKSALMSTARSINQVPMVQGAGICDAFAAARATAYSFPALLSYGLDSSQFSEWKRTDTIWIWNAATYSQSFAFNAPMSESGISITAIPAEFSLATRDSQLVMLNLKVDNTVIPYPQKGPLSYGGTILFQGTADTLRIPWAFVKASRLMLSFSGLIDPISIIVCNDKYSGPNVGNLEAIGADCYQLVVPPGTYDVFAEYRYTKSLKTIIKEFVYVDGVTQIEFHPEEASHGIATKFVDDRGVPFTLPYRYMLIGFPDSSLFRSFGFSFGAGALDTIYFSSLSKRYTIVMSESYVNSENTVVYHPQSTIHGISSDTTLGNSPSDYLIQNVVAESPPAILNHKMSSRFILWDMDKRVDNSFFCYGMSMRMSEYNGSQPWHGKAYLVKGDSQFTSGVSFDLWRDAVPPNFQNSDLWMSSPPFRVVNDSIVCSFEYDLPANNALSPSGNVKHFESTPIYTDGGHLINNVGKSNIQVTPSFYGSSDEYKSSKHAFLEIYDKSDVILFSDTLARFQSLDVRPGAYKSVVTYDDYFVGDCAGKATLECLFDLRKQDANPPMITSFKLFDARNEQVAHLQKNDKGSLSFSATDVLMTLSANGTPYFFFPPPANFTEAWYRIHGNQEWSRLPLATVAQDTNGFPPVGTYYSVDMSETTANDTSAIDIRVQIADQAGNQTQWTLEPGYAIGNYHALLGVGAKKEGERSPLTFALYQNYPNPFNPATKIGFDIPFRTHVSITVYDVLGRKLKTIVDEEKMEGRYSVTWDGINDAGYAVAGGVYFCRIEAGVYVQVRKMMLLK